jgi:hypothetical protein
MLAFGLFLIQTGWSAEPAAATKDGKPATATGQPAPASASGLANKHPEPKRIGGYSWHPPSDTVRPTSGKRGNIFFVGEPITFKFPTIDVFAVRSTVVSYEVRDYWGNLVDQGPGCGLAAPSANRGGRELTTDEMRAKDAANDAVKKALDESITVKVTTPGWYKLYCYGTDVREAWGDCIGTTTFVIVRPNANFPALPPPGTKGGSAGSMDEITRGVCGIGPQRHAVKNPITDAVANVAADVALDQQYYLPFDPLRQRALLAAFPEGVKDYAAFKGFVEQFKDRILYYEPRNEPNDSPPIPFATDEMKRFYETIKGVEPKLKVIGPGLVDIRTDMLRWVDEFLGAGGGRYLDGFSFHCYNAINGDLALARKSLDALEATLAKYGMERIEKWQTEQGFGSVCYGVYQPRYQGRWTMLEMMVFEQYGIPKERNHLWYDRSHGFWDVATWWENEDNSLEPAAALMRVYAEELYGTVFDQAYDFGPAGNNLYLGSLFTGPGKRVAAFMSAGSTDGKVDLAVRGGGKLHVVSAFGVEKDLPVVNGRVILEVPELPVYVELAEKQEVDVLPLVWGDNLARKPGVVVTSSVGDVNPEDASVSNKTDKLVNGELESWYWTQKNQGDPWMADLKSGPAWIEFALPEEQPVSHVVVYSSSPWQRWGTLLDYELQYEAKDKWVGIEHVREPTRTIGVYSALYLSTVDTFFSDRHIFRHDFPPVTTKKIRLLINAATLGGGPDQKTKEAGGQTGEFACLREVEIYGAAPATATLVTVQPGEIKKPRPVSVMVHAAQNGGASLAAIVVVRPPKSWTVSPASATLAAMPAGERKTLTFTLSPTDQAEPGILPVITDFMDKDKVIRSEKASFELVSPVGVHLSLSPQATGLGVEAMLRNTGDAPLAVNVSLSVDGALAGPAKPLTLAPGYVQSVTLPLQGVKPNGATQAIACVVSSDGKTVARKTLDGVLLPCRYIGPWACPSDEKGFATGYPPELEIDFAKTYDGADGKAGWQRGVAGLDGYFDFLPKFKTTQFVIAYAVTFIHSDGEIGARLSFGHDDGIKAWLNGIKLVSQKDGKAGGAAPGQQIVEATLKPGWNTVLIGISQNVAPWGFFFSVTDAAGKPLKGIYLADSSKP